MDPFDVGSSVDPARDCLRALTCGDELAGIVDTEDTCEVEVFDVFSEEGTGPRAECTEEELDGGEGSIQDNDSVYEGFHPGFWDIY